jgi:class 3 adenylate cyclase/TolB-like protein
MTTRRLAAVLAADVVGYSRLMGADEEGTLERLKALRHELIDPNIAKHHGRIVKTTGDGMLVEFASVVDAVRCAAEVQQAVPEWNSGITTDRRIELRIGINLGDVIADDDLYGDGVNIAARIEALADAGGVFVSGTVYEQVRDRLPFVFEDLGEQQVKNIARPVRVYRVLLDDAIALREKAPPPLGARPADLATVPQRLSIIVLPFESLSGQPEDDYLADAVTDDLTSDLSLIPDVAIASRPSYRRKPEDAGSIGSELRVRYVLKGSVRRIDTTLRVNVQLISGETGAHLWSDRFDQDIEEPAAGQDEVVRRITDELAVVLIDVESARSERERPNNPDAFDLVLRARSIRNRPSSEEREREQFSLLERALRLDPTCVYAMTYIAYYLANSTGYDGWQNFDDLQRAERLLTQARAIAPESPVVFNTYVLWLRTVGRCAEVIEACQRAIQLRPNRTRVWLGIFHELGRCKTWTGHAEEGIALEEEANQLNPRSPLRYLRHRHIGWYSLLLGRDLDAIEHYERSFEINAEPDRNTHWQYRRLAAAYARTGRMRDARQYIARAERLRPCETARGCAPDVLVSEVFVEQYRRFQDALRLAGLRDHADEDADFGVPLDAVLHGVLAGPTPMEVPGATTIRTPDLVRLLSDDLAVVVDTLTGWRAWMNTWKRSARHYPRS